MSDLAVTKCPNCGAQLPVAAADTTVQCGYCGRQSAVRRPGFGPPPPFGTAPSPPPFQPGPAPPPFGQPYGAPAPGPVPARSGSGGAMLVVLIAAFGVLIAGGVAAMLAFSSSGAHHGAARERDDIEEAPVASPGADDPKRSGPGATATKAAAANLFEKPAEIVTTVEEAHGRSVKLKQIVIHKEHGTVTVQKADGTLSRHVYRAGTLKPFGSPPRLSKRDKRQLDKLLFSFGQIDFDKLPDLASKAVERLGWQGAEISHIMIQHGTPFAHKVLIRVYVKSPTESGRVEYDLQGREHRVFR